MNNELNDNAAMIEETGEIIAVQGKYLIIETEQHSSCNHCNIGDNCGTSVLAGFFGRRRKKVKVLNHMNLSIGDQAVIGIDEKALLGTAAIAYMLPLILLIMFSVITNLAGLSDDITFITGMSGLFIGMKLSNRIMGKKDYQSKEIVLLRKANESHINFRGYLA